MDDYLVEVVLIFALIITFINVIILVKDNNSDMIDLLLNIVALICCSINLYMTIIGMNISLYLHSIAIVCMIASLVISILRHKIESE